MGCTSRQKMAGPWCLCAKQLQSRLTLCDLVDCSLPGSSVHEIFQARILKWVAMSPSRRSSWPRDRTHVSCVSCIGKWVLYHKRNLGSPGKPQLHDAYFGELEKEGKTPIKLYKWEVTAAPPFLFPITSVTIKTPLTGTCDESSVFFCCQNKSWHKILNFIYVPPTFNFISFRFECYPCTT